MKIVFIYRSSLEGNYLASNLVKKYKDTLLISETGSKAKLRKLKRTFPINKLYLWPIRAIDLVSLQIYESFYSRYLSHKLTVKYPQPVFEVDDVNDISCLKKVLAYKPTMIVVFGTAIIREPFLTKVKTPLYNIHTGILPKYRNVHSEFWAYKNKDYQNMGVTLIHVDEGIDSGAIALQKTVHYEKKEGLFQLRLKVFKLILPLLFELILLESKHKTPKVKQQSNSAQYFKTPGFVALLNYAIKEIYYSPATS